ncbi:tRNA (adenine(22)-N(1))-methyltransferase [Alkalicoccus halolimnae]|uniref:tRNA (Adenine(22)-N(1))-methyltransferase TrmK n=1 Tax=Alkalicoccus halolimnae TaxID=1667239 RepID=A0A5C7FGJ8_9BACI|nr:tRNA (adenine(22)-N(1))-methyltransferase TrmK [Alkalicoccus halolimnae]TXF86427.1 tRNA (adenine-N(1))-methyltransferase [Alkalicoccus halolimnae]
MNEQHLSKRLEKVAEFVLEEGTVADIGSDHAYLPVYLVGNGLCEYAIAGELNEGPYASAIEKIRANDLQGKVEARQGDGLNVLDGRKADTVVIAGMGGPLIVSILKKGQKFLPDVKRLVLQPNVAADQVRYWLKNNGWSLIDEAILMEDGHVYEVLVADRSGVDPYDLVDMRKQLWLGPYLMEERSEAFHKKWKREYDQLKRIYGQLQLARQKQARHRVEELEQKMRWLEEVLS